jgi:hypothetical protein
MNFLLQQITCPAPSMEALSGWQDAWTWPTAIGISLVWVMFGRGLGVSQMTIAQGITLCLSLMMSIYVEGVVARTCPGLRSFSAALCKKGRTVSVLAALGNLILSFGAPDSWFALSGAGVTLALVGSILPIAILTIAFSTGMAHILLQSLLFLVCLSVTACATSDLLRAVVLVAAPPALLVAMRLAPQTRGAVSATALHPVVLPFTETELLERLHMLNGCLCGLRNASAPVNRRVSRARALAC